MSIQKDISKSYTVPVQGRTIQNPGHAPKTVEEARAEWDETLLSEDSMELLKMMGDEAEREYNAGKTRKGGWGD
jgi:hypothetical protein